MIFKILKLYKNIHTNLNLKLFKNLFSQNKKL